MNNKNKTLINLLIASINALSVLFIVYLIKSNEEKSLISESAEENTKIIPVSQKIIEKQNIILTDRENKLRDLNNTPKDIKQEVKTITTTTTTEDTTQISQPKTKSDAKTKSS